PLARSPGALGRLLPPQSSSPIISDCREESQSADLKSESDARENTRIQNVYSGKASRVLRVLLQKPRTWNLTTLGNELQSETRVNPFVSAESDVRRRELEQSWNQIKK